MRGADLTPELVLAAYAEGIFPMADGRDDPEVAWVEARKRGVLPLDGLRVSRSLARTLRRGRFTVTFDQAFEAVMEGCAEREETWISREIQRVFTELHHLGQAHSVEVWAEDALAGGLYGVALGSAFFGESMFSRQRDASKVAIVHLVERLRVGGFVLLDTQFLTPHLASLGGVELGRAVYRRNLAEAVRRPGRW